MLTIIDQNGVFDFEEVFCACSVASIGGHIDEQLLQSGLFPATFKSIKTVFTFSILDGFLKDNSEPVRRTRCPTGHQPKIITLFLNYLFGQCGCSAKLFSV